MNILESLENAMAVNNCTKVQIGAAIERRTVYEATEMLDRSMREIGIQTYSDGRMSGIGEVKLLIQELLGTGAKSNGWLELLSVRVNELSE